MIRLIPIPLAVLACTFEDAREAPSLDAAAAPAVAEAATPPAGAAEAPVQARPGLGERYDFERPLFEATLPNRLDEISGLANTSDGRLFGHNDERGRVHALDGRTGEVGKRFDLGDGSVRDDLEGIAIVGERMFMVSSRGLLYEFREADDGGSTPHHVSDTGLGDTCEVEGLDHLAPQQALIFACKVSTPERGTIVLPRIPIDPAAPRLPPIEIARAQLPAHGLGEDFQPSAVALSPLGTLVVLSATQESIIEVDLEGRVLSAVSLSRIRHRQPEGVAFGPDGTLYIADEENDQDARLTAYALRPPTAP